MPDRGRQTGKIAAWMSKVGHQTLGDRVFGKERHDGDGPGRPLGGLYQPRRSADCNHIDAALDQLGENRLCALRLTFRRSAVR